MTILAETPQWIAINKPAGLVVERDKYGYPSAEEEVRAYLRKQNKREPFVGIVHRLDRPVSGVLLLAKKKSALKQLNEQFRLRQVQKVYWAVVENRPPGDQGLLEGWIQKDVMGKKAVYSKEAVKGALPCSLSYKLLAEAEGRYLLEIIPHTGKFHQIRVQLAAIGCPIIGDQAYGSTVEYASNAIALHARVLSFSEIEMSPALVPRADDTSLPNPKSQIRYPKSISAPLPDLPIWHFENIEKI
ncbi:MAG: RNA pseudouridine synthase [Saprospiraceae bacterium]|jgi:23S rRNA pseudouridine1911/1915/1917 synthase|nr:RNA pseudouridine synthase [Saprospiraceae bacterium]